MQVKKWVASGLAALMAGATLAGAAMAATQLGNFPTFLASTTTTGSALNALVVVGATAQPSDVVGAIDLATSLATTNYNTVSTSTTSTVSITGGTSLSTAGNPLYLGASLNSVKSTLTSSDLSSLLAGGTLNINNNGDQYTYSQYIDMQSRPNVTFDTASGSTAPVLGLYFPGSAAAYKYRIVFAKPVAETTTNLRGNSINMLGGTYIVTAATNDTSGFTEIDLLGGPNPKGLSVGQSATFTVGTTSYNVTFSSVATSGSTNVAVTTINGQTYNLYDGSPIQLSDGTWVGATNVLTVGSSGSGTATLFVGGNKLVLQSTGTLTRNNNVVSGATVSFVGNTVSATTAKISEIDVQYAPSTDIMVAAGGTYADPVFGAFKFAFADITPSLSDTANRETISITPSSTVAEGVSFKDSNGKTLTQNFAYNASGAIAAKDASGKIIHLNESDVIGLNEYAVVSQGTIPNVYGHILQLTSVAQSTSSSSGTATFTDVASGTSYSVSLANKAGTGTQDTGTLYLDGYAYNVSNTSTANQVTIRWANSGTQPITTSGSTQYIYPSIKSNLGANVAIAGPVIINLTGGAEGTNFQRLLQFPTSSTTVNITFANTSLVQGMRLMVDGTVIADASNPGGALAKQVGKVWYVIKNISTIVNTSTSVTVQIDVGNTQSSSATSASNTTLGVPSIIVMADRDNNSNRHAIVIPTTATATQIGATTPLFTNGITNTPSVAGASRNEYMDYWGSKVTYSTPSTGANTVSISYPNQQSIATVSVGANPVSSSVTTGGTGTKSAVAITSSIAKLDTEVTATDKTANNLVLVGGPCVNTLVQDLVTAGKLSSAYTCAGGTLGSAWTASNAYIIAVDDAFATGKVALVVAGTAAADTRLATSVLQANKLAGKTDSKVMVSGTVANPTFGTAPA
ncbi:S-layer protein [archaeon]|nr:MAG: S-layer protein [archaeon]